MCRYLPSRPNISTPRAAKMKNNRKKSRPKFPTCGKACITVSSRALIPLAIFRSLSTKTTKQGRKEKTVRRLKQIKCCNVGISYVLPPTQRAEARLILRNCSKQIPSKFIIINYYYKGRIISKCLFGVFNFLKKMNENKST